MAGKKVYASKLRIAYRLIRFTNPHHILLIEPRHILTDATGEPFVVSTEPVNLACGTTGDFLEILDRLYNEAAVLPVFAFEDCLVHATNATIAEMQEASGESDIERDRR
jgi:hypothetical protein